MERGPAVMAAEFQDIQNEALAAQFEVYKMFAQALDSGLLTRDQIEQVLGKRISQQRQIESVRIQIEVPGDSAREVGDLIYFSHPSDEAEDKQSGITKEHKYLSGRYLITALRHKITGEEYTMIIEASKDSYLSEPSSGFKANIPKTQTPDGTGTVEDNVS